MNRSSIAAALALMSLLVLIPASARADSMEMPEGEHNNIGIGFHHQEAPLGVRWWLAGQKVAIDLGLGFENATAPFDPDESVTNWAFDVGVPIVLKSWNRVHALFRPGILYQLEEVEVDDITDTGDPPYEMENIKIWTISGEIEAEVFLMENFSVSASTGLGYTSVDFPLIDDNDTSFGTLGFNFTDIGFHLYLF